MYLKTKSLLVACVLSNEEFEAKERKAKNEERDHVRDQKCDSSVLKREKRIANDGAEPYGGSNSGQNEGSWQKRVGRSVATAACEWSFS